MNYPFKGLLCFCPQSYVENKRYIKALLLDEEADADVRSLAKKRLFSLKTALSPANKQNPIRSERHDSLLLSGVSGTWALDVLSLIFCWVITLPRHFILGLDTAPLLLCAAHIPAFIHFIYSSNVGPYLWLSLFCGTQKEIFNRMSELLFSMQWPSVKTKKTFSIKIALVVHLCIFQSGFSGPLLYSSLVCEI